MYDPRQFAALTFHDAAVRFRDGADTPVRVNLEINPRHNVIKRLSEIQASNPERAKLVAEQLLDNALISAGLLDDATTMVARLNKLLETV